MSQAAVNSAKTQTEAVVNAEAANGQTEAVGSAEAAIVEAAGQTEAAIGEAAGEAEAAGRQTDAAVVEAAAGDEATARGQTETVNTNAAEADMMRADGGRVVANYGAHARRVFIVVVPAPKGILIEGALMLEVTVLNYSAAWYSIHTISTLYGCLLMVQRLLQSSNGIFA
jgi:hypothetical protein